MIIILDFCDVIWDSTLWRLMDCSLLVAHKAMTAAVYKEIVCFLVACLCHTSSSISVSPNVKCSLSRVPVTIMWTQTRNAALTWFSPIIGRREGKGLAQLDSMGEVKALFESWQWLKLELRLRKSFRFGKKKCAFFPFWARVGKEDWYISQVCMASMN